MLEFNDLEFCLSVVRVRRERRNKKSITTFTKIYSNRECYVRLLNCITSKYICPILDANETMSFNVASCTYSSEHPVATPCSTVQKQTS